MLCARVVRHWQHQRHPQHQQTSVSLPSPPRVVEDTADVNSEPYCTCSLQLNSYHSRTLPRDPGVQFDPLHLPAAGRLYGLGTLLTCVRFCPDLLERTLTFDTIYRRIRHVRTVPPQQVTHVLFVTREGQWAQAVDPLEGGTNVLLAPGPKPH
jgi:hypothetical protein